MGLTSSTVAPIVSALSRTTSGNTLLNTDFQAVRTTYQVSGTRPTDPIGGRSVATVLAAQTVTTGAADTSGAAAQALIDQRDQALTTIQNALGGLTNLAKQLSDGDKTGIFGQRYDVSGNAVAGEFQVNTGTANTQSEGTLATLSDGGFVSIYTSDGQDGDGDGVFGQRFDANGNAVGTEFQVNTTTANAQNDASVTALADGGFVVAYTSQNQDGDAGGVFTQRFDAAGAKVGGEVQVNTTTALDQNQASVTALADGGYVVTFKSGEQSLADLSDAQLTTILGDLGTLSASVDQAASDLQASVDAYAASVDLSAAGANTLLSGTSDIFGTVDAAFADFLTTLGAISSSTLDTRLNDVGADFATLTGDFTTDFNSASPALAGVDSSFAALATQAQNTTVVATQTSQTVFVEKTVARNNPSPTHVAFGSLGQAGQMTPGVAERAALSRPTAAVADETTEAVADAIAPETTKPVARTAQQIGQSVLEQSGIAAQTYSLNQSLISMLSRSQFSISA